MDEAELLRALLELADSLGIPVQRLGRQPALEGLAPSASARCVVRGQVRVMLADSDPLRVRIEVLARTLREAAGAALEERFLPPALRACLERAGESDGA